MIVVPEDAADGGSGRDVMLALLMVTVGAITEEVTVGGKVRGGRFPQRALKSAVPNDAAVRQVPENEIKWGRLPSRSGSNTLTRLGSIGITQFAHCWISVSLPSVQRQEIAVQESYNAAAGVHVLAH